MANTLTLAQVAAEALALPPGDRAILGDQLMESLDAEEDSPVSEEWLAEIKRRCDEIDAGTVETIPAGEFFARMRRKLHEAS